MVGALRGIRKLPAHIVHQIAAGEVVERPASALKELMENSLDAQASQISVQVQEGGLERLIVEDNGLGIAESDLPLAFEAHATSKFSDFEDFKTLQTYGFRGEALAALGSVSELEIWTSTPSASIGFKGAVRFGVQEVISAADKRIGTKVSVRNLFSRHPARLKFMKSVRSEAQAITQVFRKYALAVPDVAWSLETGASKTLRVSKGEAFDRALWFFESDEPDQWMKIEHEGQWKLKAFCLRPRFFGKCRSGIQLFLNARPFKDQRLEFAIRRAFEGFTLDLRSISAAVYIEGSPELFDVNVHPMKSEVRFLNADSLFSEMVKGIRGEIEREHRVVFSPPPESSGVEIVRDLKPLSLEMNRAVLEPLPQAGVQMSFEREAPLVQRAFEFSASEVSRFEFLSSIDDTYLMVRKGASVYLFDQHALHERILYERLLKEFQQGHCISSQRLLFPIPVLIENAEALMESEEVLEKLGFELRLWNDGKLQVVAAPSILKRDHQLVLQKLSESKELPLETLVRDVLASMACHSAVRAHDKIERPEIERLLRDFESEDALGHCPHGRPTYVEFRVKDLEKLFQRVN